MKQTNTFDVLVVYTESVATSASSKKKSNTTPFALAKTREHYSIAYAYFLKKCAQLNLKVAFTTSKDITGPGTCKSYWEYKNKKWLKVQESGFAPIIFDKVSPLRKSLQKRRELLFSNGIAQPFNDPDLLTLFNDKYKTFEKLQDFAIPTVVITQKTVISAISKLKSIMSSHKNSDDFLDSFVLKDQFGAGGLDIYKVGKNPIDEITKILSDTPKISYILQPFAKFDRGFFFNNIPGYIDVRIIYSRGKIVQRYIRTAKKEDFRCNEHQGGKVIYIKSKSVPQSIKDVSVQILKILNKKNALFALDFLVSNNGNAYFLEGNINPGIYWSDSAEDKKNTKKLIDIIVKELSRRTLVGNIKIPERVTYNIPVFIPAIGISKLPLVV